MQAATVQRDLTAACRAVQPSHPGFHPYWCYNTAAGGARSAGMAVLIRGDLVSSGAVVVEQHRIQAQQHGCMLVVPTQVGGTLSAAGGCTPTQQQHRPACLHWPACPTSHASGGRLPARWRLQFCGSRHLAGQDQLSCSTAGPGSVSGSAQPPPAGAGAGEPLQAATPTAAQLHTPPRHLRSVLGPLVCRGGVAEYVMPCHTHDKTPSHDMPVILRLAAKHGPWLA
jgi:hypothetical protein